MLKMVLIEEDKALKRLNGIHKAEYNITEYEYNNKEFKYKGVGRKRWWKLNFNPTRTCITIYNENGEQLFHIEK